MANSCKFCYPGIRGGFNNRTTFPDTITHKIFETNSSFHMKQRTTGKV